VTKAPVRPTAISPSKTRMTIFPETRRAVTVSDQGPIATMQSAERSPR
jgi:hypothetical protein